MSKLSPYELEKARLAEIATEISSLRDINGDPLDLSAALDEAQRQGWVNPATGVWGNGGETAIGTDDLDPDVYQAPPRLDPKMLYGIAPLHVRIVVVSQSE
jgi:hypothetical protein